MTAAVERRDPVALARAEDDRHWDALYRRATVLSKTRLVPKECQNSPDTTMAALLTLEAYGLQPNMVSLGQLHFIENRPEPSAQMLAGLLGRAGYEIDWTELGTTRAAARIRRVAQVPGGTDGHWSTEISWTIDQAEAAGLRDQWVEKRTADGTWPDGKPRWRTEKFVLNRPGVAEPDWVLAERAAGRVKRNENWWRYPDDMLASKVVRRLVKRFAAHITLGVDDDELAPSSPAPVSGPADGEDPYSDDDDPVDAEIIDDQQASSPGGGDDDLVHDDWVRRFAIRIRTFADDHGHLSVDADELRHAIVRTATRGRTASAREVRTGEAAAVATLVHQLLDGAVQLHQAAGGDWTLIEAQP